MNFVRRPETFDVVVASNLFGDLLTDLGGISVPSGSDAFRQASRSSRFAWRRLWRQGTT